MKKIGILTFHTPDNFGAVLQAFALQTHLSETGNNFVEIIDYHTKKHDKDNRIIKKVSGTIIVQTICFLCVLLRLPEKMIRHSRYEKFRKTYMHLSNRCQSGDDIVRQCPHYDIVISGSDQVFNPSIKDSEVYYLSKGFDNTRKVAYAPSFGISDFETLSDNQLIWLSNFEHLSCRENNGANFLSSLTGKHVPCVVDPTFLLEKKEWAAIALPPNYENYIFVYELNAGNKVISIAKMLSKMTGLPIICSTSRTPLLSYGYRKRYDMGPREILGYIQKATYVVTDSFHGTALSLIMWTKVIPYIALKSTSSRIISLMEQLGLENNIVTNVEDYKPEEMYFNSYFDKLNILIEKSKQYLQISTM